VDARRLVVERGLVPAAVAAMTAQAFGHLPFEAMGPTKALLKRFFSPRRWDADDDEALADAVGPGTGWWAEPLDAGISLEFGWEGSRFRLRATTTRPESPAGAHLAAGDDGGPSASPAESAAPSLEATFEGPIAPEATPNPRTIVFRTGPLHAGDSRSYHSGATVDDPRVAELLVSFPDIATVLVARRFVALTLRRPDRWEAILAPVLDAVTAQFPAPADPGTGTATTAPPGPAHGGPAALGAVPRSGRAADADGLPAPAMVDRATRLDRAWRELGDLRAGDPDGLERIIAAASNPDAAFRQVAAGLVGDGPAEVALQVWESLAGDPSRAVRRATVDAVVDAGRDDLRPLLERALGDADAWVRWKALRGLGELGAGPSHPAVRALTADPDFRVRLEAQAVLGQEG